MVSVLRRLRIVLHLLVLIQLELLVWRLNARYKRLLPQILKSPLRHWGLPSSDCNVAGPLYERERLQFVLLEHPGHPIDELVQLLGLSARYSRIR